jgi:hypothetical protein
MRYLLQHDGRAVESRGTREDALALKQQSITAAKIAAKKTKVPIVPYRWRIVDTQTNEEVKDAVHR